MDLENKLKTYYITAVLGVVFAVIGFSYNAWRLEVSEDNNVIRTASFEVLKELAELEQVIYAAHYDKDAVNGSPRRGWVKVGLIVDMSALISHPVESRAGELKTLWQDNWQRLESDNALVNALVKKIDSVRSEIKVTLGKLE